MKLGEDELMEQHTQALIDEYKSLTQLKQSYIQYIGWVDARRNQIKRLLDNPKEDTSLRKESFKEE